MGQPHPHNALSFTTPLGDGVTMGQPHPHNALSFTTPLGDGAVMGQVLPLPLLLRPSRLAPYLRTEQQ